MVRLSKKVEYGLIAIRHIATKQYGDLATTKEIAKAYRIPYELLAKVLQKLARGGLIVSTQGVHGGYSLAADPALIQVSTIINAIEGKAPVIAECMTSGPQTCEVFSNCTIRSPLTKVQANIEKAFSSMTLSEIM
jgi:Rrf2 family protein